MSAWTPTAAQERTSWEVAEWPHVMHAGSFGQSGLPKTLDQQRYVCFPAASDPPGYRKTGIGPEHMCRRLTRLRRSSKMGVRGRETAVGRRVGSVLTKALLRRDDCFVKAMKLEKGCPHSGKQL